MVMSGSETIAEMASKHKGTIVAFSCGKDSVAAWLAIRESFDRVVPYYLYLVPGLEFVEESILHYEQYFRCRIMRLPHPSLHRMLNNMVFQPPEHCLVIEQAQLPNHSYEDVRQVVCESSGLPGGTYVADGVRAADSPMRRVAINTHGPISHGQHKYHPVWDMVKADMVALFRRHGVKLPREYNWFGRSFDGLDLRFLVPIKKHAPRDYQRILEYFPLADLEVFRWEAANGCR